MQRQSPHDRRWTKQFGKGQNNKFQRLTRIPPLFRKRGLRDLLGGRSRPTTYGTLALLRLVLHCRITLGCMGRWG
ncbi:hypothetical protein Bca52824_033936 [Brassica carinata]|uniref:Uncharacterized protein n=1 Tax=Brassica carinata TaxID=52824 RepID=A0A8X7SEW4_BRACI|nr:hypothetical protein Bca52824_033936 [Brassica carinata]